MNTPRTHGAAAALLASLMMPTSEAAIFVTGTITPLGGSYRYELSVENTGPEDFSIVSTTDAPLGDPLIAGTLTAPAGFVAAYDEGLGFLDLLENASFFGAGTINQPFTFETLAGPGQGLSTFEALTLLGDVATGTLQLRVIPEPGTATTVIALGLLAGAVVWYRRSA